MASRNTGVEPAAKTPVARKATARTAPKKRAAAKKTAAKAVTKVGSNQATNLALADKTGPLLPALPRRHLRNMSEIRTFFRTNEVPVFFVGPTAFNLLGVDRWVRNFSFISYFDSW